MRKELMLAMGAASMLMLGGCSKKLGQFQSDYFTTNPTPLATVGNQVPAVVTGRIPAKFMVKNAKVTATPILQWETASVAPGVAAGYDEVAGEPSILQGEDVRANGQVVSYTSGGTVTIPFVTEYKPEMAKSTLYLDFQVNQNGKIYALPRVKVDNGIIATSTLASAATVKPAIARDNFQKVITEKYSADIHFLINQANVRPSETSSSAYIDLNTKLREANAAPNMEIAGVSVSSYASPEGQLAFNTRLAEQREKNTTSFVEKQLTKDKITEFGELTSQFTPEDWEGFQQLVEKSNIQDKDLIIAVLKMYPDPERREQEIRNMSSVFGELADQILPQLRYSRVQATINVIGKSDQELIDQFNADPTKLTIDELLYIATLTDDNMKKMEVYDAAAAIAPKDARAFNNLGLTQFVAGDYEGARANFQQALRLDPNEKEASMNLGLTDMIAGDYNAANEHLGAAAGIPEINDALGTYYLTRGDLGKARSSFADTKSNNAALAQILTQDYAGAKQILAAIPNPDATTYYLTAIVGARTGNQNMVMNNLREAVRLDKNLLKRAQNDLEFASYNLSYL